MGLQLGHPVVDEVMLGCKTDAQGYVDYSRFVEDFEDKRALEAQTNAARMQQPPAVQRNPAAGPGQAMTPPQAAANVNRAVEHALEMERFGDTPQKKTVRQNSSTIADLYSRFDNGLCSVEAFRQSLLSVGVVETPALTRHLRTTPCEFKYKDLMDALKSSEAAVTHDRVAGARFDRADGTILSARRTGGRSPRRGAQKLGVNYSGMDVVTWRDEGNAAAGAVPAGGAGSPGRPRSNGSFSGKARGEFYQPDNASNSVKSALFRDQYNPTEAWASATQLQQNQGLGQEPVVGRANVGGKVTALRDAVYNAVRELDRGNITTNQFYRRMDAINIDLPVQMQRLVAKQKANGSAVFRECVQAMTPFFAKLERQEAARMMAPPAPASPHQQGVPVRQEANRRPRGDSESYVNKLNATKSHGDILTWSGAPSVQEVDQMNRGLGGNFPRRKTANAKPHLRATGSFVDWAQSDDQPAHSGKSRSRSARDPMASSGDIISWEKQQAQASQGRPGAVAAGSERQHNKMYGGAIPFGTDTDVQLAPPAAANGHARPMSRSGPFSDGVGEITQHKRKANVEARYAKESGQWFQPPAPSANNANRSRRSTPFGTDADL